MRKTRLNLALVSALAILGTSQAFAAPYINDHDVVVLNQNTYTDAYYQAGYEDKTITGLFVHYNAGVDASGANLVVTGGKAHRIYGAMIGYEGLIVEGAASHTVSNNQITVDGLDLNDEEMDTVTVIGGGSVYHGLATQNQVQIKNVVIEDVYGGLSHHGSANHNSVYVGEGVKAAKFDSRYYGLIVGGLVNSTDKKVYQNVERTNDNSVVINTQSNVDFLGAAIGAIVRADKDNDGHANRNTVTLESGWLALVYGAESTNGNVNNNTVIINGGLVAPHPEGSKNLPPGIIGGTSESGEVRYNHVFINGGEIAVNVYAGSGVKGNTIITDNQITVAGNADLTEASLWGSNLPGGERNALNLLTKQQVKQVGNFNIYNFNIGPSLQAGDTLLLVEDGDKQYTTDISKATLNVFIDKDAKRLNPGEKITLISDSDGLVTTDFEGNIILADPIKDYRVTFDINEENTDLVLTVFESRISPRTQSLLKGNLTRLAFVNQAGDLVADAGTNTLVDAANAGRQWFVAMQGGSNHYNMDSYIDLDGQSVMFGGALSGEAWGGHLSVGAFVEGGWADYEMLDVFDNGSTMKGKGETDYRGAGLLAYYGKVVDDNRSWWAEASVRAGRADLTYATQDWVPGYDYDLSGNYFAAHVGAGYRYALSPTQSLNLFTKAFYNRQAGEDFMIETNPIEFDTMESMRWRAGVAYEQLTQMAGGTRFFWKTSLAYEYEFESVARGRADGYQIQESDLTGSSGVAEFAMTVVPAALPNTDFKVAVQGYAGQREGVSGQVRLTHRF